MLETQIRENLTKWGQTHLIEAIDKLDDPSKLIEQIEKLDYPSMVQSVSKAKEAVADSGLFEPPAAEDVKTLESTSSTERREWWKLGLQMIGEGKVAACVLAGGQGTRMGLGIDESKGMLDIGLGKSIFHLFVERLLRLKKLSGNKDCYLPLLVMTSPLNDARVRCFFSDNKYFGYPESEICFFAQGTLPALTYPELKLILESSDSLSQSPDGNGGVYFALSQSGILDHLLSKGAKFLHVFAVDNALTRPAEPGLIGYAAQAKAEVANKVVWKSDWKEKVGVLARKDGKTTVVEYSDLYNPDAGIDNPLIRATSEAKLLFGAGNICNHLLRLDFIKRIIPELKTMYHVAHKSIPVYDSTIGKAIKPQTNNGVKLEAFIFDAFELAAKSVVLECKREEEFAPMKNSTGPDSTETALAMLLEQVNSKSGGSRSTSEFYFGEEILS